MADPADAQLIAPAPTPAPPAEPSWRDTLPDDIRNDASLVSYKDVPALAKAFIHTKAMVGAKSAVPTDKSTPEEVAAFRKALGVPDAPTGYAIKRPDVVLDGGWDTNAEATFLGAMHKLGAPPAIVQAAVDFYGRFERTKMETANAQAAQITGQLKTEWGPNFDAKVGRANRAILEFGGTALDEALTTPGHPLNAHGRHPLWIKAWAAVGDALVEHGAMTGEGLETLSPDEARSRAAEMRAELNKLPETHPRRAELVDQIIAVTSAAQRRR